ncbi:MAG TPA: NADP oxidoreductase, partial [Candidatus Acetothermia bacterium]|nr:NADP oxidoreductase [Candidatus Acetothermia bacterium]HEX32345.1 NADP oxidoreductase [Candidatus Acetothermia bacterium]
MKPARSLVLIEIEEDSLLAGAKAVEQAFSDAIKEQGLDQEVRVAETGNLGIIGRGVVVVIYPEGTTYVGVTEADVPEIVSEHLLKGRPVKRLQVCLGPCMDREEAGIGLVRDQPRIVLKNCGIIDPENLQEAIGVGTYQALERV